MHIDPEVKKRFPGMSLFACQFTGLFPRGTGDFVARVKSYLEETPDYFDSQIVKEYQALASRSGRNSKIYDLARFILGGSFKGDNPIVDFVNAFQVYEGVVASIYDFSKVSGDPRLTMAIKGETLVCRNEEFSLTGKELVLRDDKGIMSLIPVLDSDKYAISRRTKNFLLVVFGNKYIPRNQLIDIGTEFGREMMRRFGGKILGMVYVA